MSLVELTQTHVEAVRQIVTDIPHLNVLDIRLSPGRTQVVVRIAPLTVSPTTLVGNLYHRMMERQTGWYGVTHENAPGQPCEVLTFGALQ